MEKGLLRLIYDYSVKDKIIDKSYLEKFIDVVVNSQELNDYVRDMELSPDYENELSLATYNPLSKKIKINSFGILNMLGYNTKYRKLFTKIENTFYDNIQISQILLHELEHANQRKIVDTKNNLESDILRLSMAQISDDKLEQLLNQGFSMGQLLLYMQYKGAVNKKNYEENYKKAPEERLAEIKSHQEIFHLLSYIKEYIPNLLDYENTTWLEQMIRGYNPEFGYIESPTIRYLLDNSCEVGLSHFDWYDENPNKCLKKTREKYTLEDRMKFGLMIDEDEYSNCKGSIQYSRKYNC